MSDNNSSDENDDKNEIKESSESHQTIKKVNKKKKEKEKEKEKEDSDSEKKAEKSSDNISEDSDNKEHSISKKEDDSSSENIETKNIKSEDESSEEKDEASESSEESDIELINDDDDKNNNDEEINLYKERTVENVHPKPCRNNIKKNISELQPKNIDKKFLKDIESKEEGEEMAKKKIKEIITHFKESPTEIDFYLEEFKKKEKKDFFKKQKYILTNKSMERIALLIHYITCGIPVFLEGNTGTSKTRATLVACNYIKKFLNDKGYPKELIRYNLSAETKIDDIVSKYVSDPDSIIGLNIKNGPYVEAYTKGKILLFDEINLAPVNVLQSIQQSLDNGYMSIETHGRILLKKEKHPNFSLVATQNPNKGAFVGKRQDLGTEFLSRFQKIYFNDIEQNEMREIAKGIAENYGILKNSKNKELIKNIVDLHYEWAKENESQDSIHCFTIREIETVIDCLSNNYDPYEVIMTIYGGRYRKDKKKTLEEKLKKYKIPKKKVNPFPKDFPECYKNDALIETVRSVLLVLENKRNVIIVGDNESGLTLIAELCSIYFNRKHNKSSKKAKDESNICFCTNNLECSDLIGTQKISNSDDEVLKFEPKFLYNAIIKGKCVVLDSINEASPRIIERLNGLLDKKVDKTEEKFEVPENNRESEIDINKNFRIICTSNFDKINQISPAFVNRFEVIVLENQLENLDEEKYKELIKFLCIKYHKEWCKNQKKKSKKKNKKKRKKSEEKSFASFWENDEDEDDENIEISKVMEITDDMTELIYEKIIELKNHIYDIDSINDENSKKYLTMSSINKFIRAVVIFKNQFKNNDKISLKSIINFSFELLFEKNLSDENKEIQEYLLDLINKNNQLEDSNEEKYFFDNSEQLKKFMIQMYACSLVNQYLCIVGPPGVGKTLGARAFSYIRRHILEKNFESSFNMHIFNQFSQPSDYFGISSLKDGKLIFKDGTLTKSIKEGNVFIGDEFNLSSEECMKALIPVLELKFNEEMLIPGIDGKISINPNLFFVVCQNTRETFGRKELPEKFKVKIKIIDYPEITTEENENICESISGNIFNGKIVGISREESRSCGDFMMKLNKKEILPPWSLRDISKLFLRIKKQSKNFKDFEGLSIKENILFYILSSLNDSLIDEILVPIVDLIKESFKLTQNEKQELLKLYNDKPILTIEDGKLYIIKGKIKIFFCKFKEEIYNYLKGLQTILNSLFYILLASDDEPILISGPSLESEELAKLIFHNKENNEIISLNSETTISQLIGSITLVSYEQSKRYYLKQIYEILQVNNIDYYLKDSDDFEKNKELIKKNIEEFEIKREFDETYPFYYALQRFKKKLFDEDIKKRHNGLFDMEIEFKPGIFLSSKIRGKNLILKNITNVKTENLERLNEVTSGYKKITLNEDTPNTFTKENNKEISFTKNFRVVATCNEGTEASLSDAFLSRFTLIYANKYNPSEELIILKDASGTSSDYEKMNKLLEKYYTEYPEATKLNLTQKINCIKIKKEMDKKRKQREDQDPYDNLNLILYYFLKGLNEKRNNQDIYNIFEINEYYSDDDIDDPPIEIIEENYKEPFLKSKLTNLEMYIPPSQTIKQTEKDEEKNNLVFINKMKEIIDVIHFGISLKIPLVLEGEYGQGKLSAVKYYAKMANLELIEIQIFKTTKVDDLLCKTAFKKNKNGDLIFEDSKTPLYHAIECEDNFPKKLIVFEGINNASPAVLEILNSIYGKKGTNILLPNGSKIIKGNMNLISIFNPTDDFTRDKLFGNIIDNSLYYIVENPSDDDIKNIISKLFEEADLKETELFENCFFKARDIAKEGEGEFPITLHEVKKYISLRTSNSDLNERIFMAFIFIYHFNEYKNIIRAQKELKLETYSFFPQIDYDGDNQYLTFQLSSKNKNKFKIKVKAPDKIEVKKLKLKFNSLTITQKLCFLFLLCCVKAKITPIIQGGTAGKSFIIKILQEALGQEMAIYQLNSNSGLSLFTGQAIMKEELDNEEKEIINNILNLLNIKDQKINALGAKDYNNIKKIIENKLQSNELNSEEKKEYEKAKNSLLKILSPINRFIHQDSELIKSLQEGKWVTLDGFEMANMEISEKLGYLCASNPTLNIVEAGYENLYFDSSNIDPNFRLFILYNPFSKNAKKIEKSLYNKCIKFTLESIDNLPRDATTMLYNIIRKNEAYPNNSYWIDLCKRISTYHIDQTRKSRNDSEKFAGNAPITPRHLCFISKDYHNYFKKNKIPDTCWVKSIFDNYYWRSYISQDLATRKSNMAHTLEVIKPPPDYRYKVDLEPDLNIEYQEIIEYLRNIQLNVANKIQYLDFDLKEFLRNCLLIPINRETLQYISNNIFDTINLLDNDDNNVDEPLKNKFYSIRFIKSSYDNILKNYENIEGYDRNTPLTYNELLRYDNIKNFLLRMKLLYLLLDDIKIYEPNIKLKLFNQKTNELCLKLLDLINYKKKKSFEKLFIFLFDNPDNFEIIHYFYPYNNNELKDGELKYANYYIYFWYKLYHKKFDFSVRFDDIRYDIKFQEDPQNKKPTSYFIFNEENSLKISKGSYIKRKKYIKKLNETKEIFFYLEKTPDENTKEMLENIRFYFNSFNHQFPIKTLEEINDFQLETLNFFSTISNSLISRILPLIINLADQFQNIIKYFKKSFGIFEKDALEILEEEFYNLPDDLDSFIKKIKEISFFCESESTSMLWKYRILLNNLSSKDDNQKNKFYKYFKAEESTDIKDVKKYIEEEKEKLDKLNIFWKEDNIQIYKTKLNELRYFLSLYEDEDNKNEEIKKLRNEGKNLLFNLDNNIKNKTSSIKYLNLLKEKILLYNENPEQSKLDELKNEVNNLINIINLENEKLIDALNLPNKNEIKIIDINKKNLILYDILFWYSYTLEKLEKLSDKNISKKSSIELTKNLLMESELEPIVNYINDKKIELINNWYKNRSIINQMLRGIFISKIRNNEIELNDVKNIVDVINSRVNNISEIPEEEFYFTYIISSKYPKNLKIKMPIFETNDVFYLFYNYHKKGSYKLDKFFEVIDTNFVEKMENIPEEILNNKFDDMISFSEEIGKLFYENIYEKELKNDDNLDIIDIINSELESEKSQSKKDFLNKILSNLEFIKSFHEVVIQSQKEHKDKYLFRLDDFYNLVNDKKMMNCSEIFKKQIQLKEEDKNKYLSPSLIFYLNNNQSFIDELFNEITASSIITDSRSDLVCEYLPFWLYILRNISSLNCIMHDQKDIEPNITKNIVDKIKKEISYSNYNLKWINLLVDNISPELLDQNIHYFYYYFNALISNLDVPGEYLMNFAKNEIENYISIIIDYVFDNNIDNLFDENYKNSENIILKWTTDPSNYLYEKIKSFIKSKFFELMSTEKIIDIFDDIIKKIKVYKEEFINQIIKVNEKLKNNYSKVLEDNKSKKINDKCDDIFRINENYKSVIDKIRKDSSNNQIFEEEMKNLNEMKNQLLKYNIYGVKEGEEEKLVLYKLNYDFTPLKNKQYSLNYMKQIIKTDKSLHKGNIYIINDRNEEDMKKLFNINMKENYEDDEEEEIESIKDEEDNKEIEVKNFIDFEKIETIKFLEFTIDDEEKIRKLIEENTNNIDKMDVKDSPQILLSGLNVDEFSKCLENLINLSGSLLSKFNKINNDPIYANDNDIIKTFEKEAEDLVKLLTEVKNSLKLNYEDDENLNNLSQELEKEIDIFLKNLNNFNQNYNKEVKIIFKEFFSIKEENPFCLNFKIQEIPKKIHISKINLDSIDNIKLKQICIPIISLDNEGKNLKCCYESLHFDLGKICPIFYQEFYIINIISLVDEDLFTELNCINEQKMDKEFKEENIANISNVNIEDQIKFLKVKDLFKKGENIQLFVKVCPTNKEEIYKLTYTLTIRTNSGKRLDLRINIDLTVIPINVLVSCDEYNLIKEEINTENSDICGNVTKSFKLDAAELFENELINFKLSTYEDEEPISFYLSAESLGNNTSEIPEFSKSKQSSNFYIKIPKFEYKSEEDYIPRLNCKIQVYINKNFIIYFTIDCAIKPIKNIFKIYDFYSKSYVENQMIIYLNEKSLEIFKTQKKNIQLNCRLFSTLENNEFTVLPDAFIGGKITTYKGIIVSRKAEFFLELEINDYDKIIENETEVCIKIKDLKGDQVEFKIKFSYPPDNVFSDDYYKVFKIFGKDEKNKELEPLLPPQETKLYVTPFYVREFEIDYENAPKEFKFYYINNEGIITSSSSKGSINDDEYLFSLSYEDQWFPLIEPKISYHHLKNYDIALDLDTWNKIKIKILVKDDYEKWKELLFDYDKKLYDEIPHIKNFNEPDEAFYKEWEKKFEKHIKNIINIFKKMINKIPKNEITFERLIYYLFENRETLKNLHRNVLSKDIRENLDKYYNKINIDNSKDEGIEQNIALVNYILKFIKFYGDKKRIFNEQKNKIKLLLPDLKEKQIELLFKYYTIENIDEDIPKLLIKYESDIQLLNQEISHNGFKSCKQFLIKGNDTEEFDKNIQENNDDSDDHNISMEFEKDIEITLPKIELNQYEEKISLNNIIELYKNLVIISKLFPAYLQLEIKKNNNELQNYFDILFNIYISGKKTKTKNSSLISLSLNEFNEYFEDLVIKLKNFGATFDKNDNLKLIVKKKNQINPYIIKPLKIEPIKQNDIWKNKKDIESRDKINLSVNIKKYKKIKNNMKSEKINSLDISSEFSSKFVKANKEHKEPNASFGNISNIKIIDDINEDDDKEFDIKFASIINEKEEDNSLNISNFATSRKEIDKTVLEETEDKEIKDNEVPEISEEDFNKIEKNYNEDYALNYIIDKMRNNLNKEELCFRYESFKNKGYTPKNLYPKIDKNEKFPIIENLIEDSKFLSSLIYSYVAQYNSDNSDNSDKENKEIPFKKLEANIIIDTSRTINDKNKYFNMLMICGLSSALYYMGIPYSLSLMGDSNFKVRIKDIKDRHHNSYLQKLYDCCFIRRNVTQLATCLRYFMDEYPPTDNSKKRVYYIFTNGYDYELTKYKAWQEKIFNDAKNSFAFIFTKSENLGDSVNSKNNEFLEDIWDKFKQESENSFSIVSLTRINLKEKEYKELASNLSKVLLRDNSKIVDTERLTALFNIDKSAQLTIENIRYYEKLINDKTLNKFDELYVKKNKINSKVYDSKNIAPKQYKKFCENTGKIIRYNNIDSQLQIYIKKIVKKFKKDKTKIKRNLMNIIFEPNLPTQTALVEEGNHLDLIEFFKYKINPVPNPRLYREMKDGLIKNYGVSIIIDTSISCLNDLSILHTVQTLIVLLNALSSDDIPCLDIVITRAKEPIILCSEKSVNEVLSENSGFFGVLLSCLQGEESSDLFSAIKAVYNLNLARKSDYTSYLFVLTDGLYSFSERDIIISAINSCTSKNINVFGIGVGMYPCGIGKLFRQAIYAQNPSKLIEGLALIFGDISKYKNIPMKQIIWDYDQKKIISKCNKYIKQIDQPIYKELKNELSKIKINLESFPFHHPELKSNKDGENPSGENSEMYGKNFFLGQKILFAMFFSSDMESQKKKNITEDEKKINPKNVTKNEKDEECISSVLEPLGYRVDVVTNYEDAINELLKKTKDNKCLYNSLWVVSGQEIPDLPKSNNMDPNAPYYVGQFADCAIEFWKNGGSLVLLAENDPHHFQANLILEKLTFPPYENNGKKLNFKIRGNNPGGKILKADKSGKLENPCTFNKKIQEVNNYQRQSLAYNLKYIFEGETVAYADGDNIEPFIPFSRDSSGKINSLFYLGQDRENDKGEGDIFIDCGYTKFFLNMKKKGTYRYLQNIAGFIGAAERRYLYCDPKSYRPEGLNFVFDKNKYYNYKITPYDVVYLVDATGSMGKYIAKVKDYCVDIADALKKELRFYNFQFGAVFYRDPVDNKEDKNEYFDLTSDTLELQKFVESIEESGGGDTPEDWNGGYNMALNKIHWREGTKIIVHIADAGAHGTKYSEEDKYPEEGPKLDDLITKCINKDIKIIQLKIDSKPQRSFSRVQELYENAGKKKYCICEDFDKKNESTEYFKTVVVDNIITVTYN